jgi:hypothetical protein
MSRIKDLKRKYGVAAVTAAQQVQVPVQNRYLEYVLKAKADGHSDSEIESAIKFFHDNSKRMPTADIQQYKTFIELKTAIDQVGASARSKEKVAQEGAEKIYQDSEWTVVWIKNKLAKIKYGKHTRWCTTEEDSTTYEDYEADGDRFYVVIQKAKGRRKEKKFCIHFCFERGVVEPGTNFLHTIWPDSISVFDERDNEIDSSPLDSKVNQAVLQHWMNTCYERSVLFQICDGEFEGNVLDWLSNQPASTSEYVVDRGVIDFSSLASPKQRKDGVVARWLLNLKANAALEFIDNLVENTARGQKRELGASDCVGFCKVMQETVGSEDQDVQKIRRKMVRHLRQKELNQLFEDPDDQIRLFVASKCSRKIQHKMLLDRNPDVVSVAIENVGTKRLEEALKTARCKGIIRAELKARNDAKREREENRRLRRQRVKALRNLTLTEDQAAALLAKAENYFPEFLRNLDSD